MSGLMNYFYRLSEHPFFSKSWLSAAFVCFVFLYALLFLLDQSIFKAAVKIFPLAVFVSVILYAKYYLRSSVFAFTVWAIATPLLSWLFMKLDNPELAFRSPNIKPVLDNFLFIPIGLVLLGDKPRTFAFWGAAVVSAFALPWVVGDGLIEWERFLNGIRTGFGGHEITMGMVYANILIGLLVFFRRIFGVNKYRALVVALWCTTILLATICIIASQTRAIYLGLAASLFIWFALSALLGTEPLLQLFKRLVLGVGFVFVVLFGSYKLGLIDDLVHKVSTENNISSALIDLNLDEIPRNSSGLRIHFWVDAWDEAIKRPLFGWDRDTSKRLHVEAGEYFRRGVPFQSVHNDFLQLFLEYGLFGVCLFLGVLLWVLHGLLRLWRAKALEFDVLVFIVLSLSFFLINGLFMSTWFFMESKFLWNVIMGGATGFLFRSIYLENTCTKTGAQPGLP